MALILTPNNHDKEKEYQKLKKRAENQDIVQYPLRIPTHIHTKFKTKLTKERKNIREVVLKMIMEYIED